MIHPSPRVSNSALNHAHMTAAKIAAIESVTERRLIMLSRLRIGTVRRSLLTAIGRGTYNCYVSPVTASRAVEMWLKNRRSLRDKSAWPDLTSLAAGRTRARAAGKLNSPQTAQGQS